MAGHSVHFCSFLNLKLLSAQYQAVFFSSQPFATELILEVCLETTHMLVGETMRPFSAAIL